MKVAEISRRRFSLMAGIAGVATLGSQARNRSRLQSWSGAYRRLCVAKNQARNRIKDLPAKILNGKER